MPSDIPITIPRYVQTPFRDNYDPEAQSPDHWSLRFRIYKPCFDILCSLVALPLIAVTALALLLLNPWFNPGPLFFTQQRMGHGRVPFKMIKFRTMTTAPDSMRDHTEQLETHRITPLGAILRKLRLDELPNFFNVLRGEMSVIGPRPDSCAHAEAFLNEIPHYKHRYMVKPGITGLAQVYSGYAEGVEATALKASYDQFYVERSCGRMDLFITLRTIQVMATGFGAK